MNEKLSHLVISSETTWSREISGRTVDGDFSTRRGLGRNDESVSVDLMTTV
ncbi:MAG: hypothetical protein Q8R16_02530 [bacterium]|nr:hypothetical protein [bacterium]